MHDVYLSDEAWVVNRRLNIFYVIFKFEQQSCRPRIGCEMYLNIFFSFGLD